MKQILAAQDVQTNENMLHELLNVDVRVVNAFLFIVSICFVCVFLTVLSDFVCGVMRSKRNGIPISSKAFRRSVTKLIEYFCMLAVISIVGVLVQYSISAYGLVNIPKIPILSIFITVAICLIEFKSILENLQDSTKKNVKEVIKLFSALDKTDKDSVIRQFLKYLEDEK